jgi:hypothetical protein
MRGQTSEPSSPKDAPGRYVIEYDRIPVTMDYSRRSDVLGKLSKGTTVTVVEVHTQLEEGRTRARLQEPVSGWISLRYPAGGDIYAYPAPAAEIGTAEQA